MKADNWIVDEKNEILNQLIFFPQVNTIPDNMITEKPILCITTGLTNNPI